MKRAQHINASALVGGLTAETFGGNFWDGARQGATSAALNELGNHIQDNDKAKKASSGGDYLTFSDAKSHYQFGGGAARTVSLNKLDLSKVSMSDFGSNGLAAVRLDGKHLSNLNDGLVHGTITLERLGNTNQARVAYNREVDGRGGMYNFEMHSCNSAFNIFVRNPLTFIGGLVNGTSVIFMPYGVPLVLPTGGMPYPIYYEGTVTIPD